MPAYKPLRYPSILKEIKDLQRAVELMRLGGRLQMIESIVDISHQRLLRLHHEVCDHGPSKGLLPFSSEWHILWRNRIHSSVWMDIYNKLTGDEDDIERMIRAHRMYEERCLDCGAPIVLSITRAWNMLSLFRSGTFDLKACAQCQGEFVVYRMDLNDGFVCGICNPPSRVGKTKRSTASKMNPNLDRGLYATL